MKPEESNMKQTEQIEIPDFFIIRMFYFYPEGYTKFDETLIIV